MVEHDDSSLHPVTTSPPPPVLTITTGGIIISTTNAIRSFLEAASTDCHLSEDLRDLSSSLIVHSSIPYTSLRSIWIGSEPDKRPDLSAILSGCEFLFAGPKPREKGEELKARLAKLAEVAERKMYEELVKDITPRKHEVEPFSSYKDQLGFGLHVVLIMFTGYLLGYAAFRALFSHIPAMNAAGGILGLVLGMLVETLLFIVRSTCRDLGSPSSTSKMIKKNQ
ncbi:uncharacterized protein [Primulina huaijiensis]|uniref:uncharacterized protein n=1 Tax=Primulina huaijiensis TaxID=1492673 RepID=UPI003CC700D4